MVNYFEKKWEMVRLFSSSSIVICFAPGAMWETPTLAQMPGLRWKEHRSAGPARRAGIRRRRMNIDSVKINTSLIMVREWTIPNGWRMDRGLPQLNGQLSHLWQSLIWRQKAWPGCRRTRFFARRAEISWTTSCQSLVGHSGATLLFPSWPTGPQKQTRVESGDCQGVEGRVESVETKKKRCKTVKNKLKAAQFFQCSLNLNQTSM